MITKHGMQVIITNAVIHSIGGKIWQNATKYFGRPDDRSSVFPLHDKYYGEISCHLPKIFYPSKFHVCGTKFS